MIVVWSALLLTAAVPGEQAPLPAACVAVKQGSEQARAWHPDAATSATVDVVFDAIEPWCHGWTVVQVLHGWNGSQSRWEMRRTRGSGDAPAAAPRIDVARSENCPEMISALTDLQRLPIRFGLGAPLRADEPPRPIMIPMMDGIHYSIEARSAIQPSGRNAALRLSSNDGEVAAWVEKTFSRLKSCWR